MDYSWFIWFETRFPGIGDDLKLSSLYRIAHFNADQPLRESLAIALSSLLVTDYARTAMKPIFILQFANSALPM